MDWRVLVLIVSLLLNAYLFSSSRNLAFQANELTQSATRHRRELSLIANQLDQSLAASARLTDGLSEKQLNELIASIAQTEMYSTKPDCGPLRAHNGQRLNQLQGRFHALNVKVEGLSKKAASTTINSPLGLQELSAQIKSEVLSQCKR